ncbi:MAG: ShlB/FhaC/HecB family hemolysin secretion/activation protein [Chlorobiaceae bacterium]|nr:ShlB/FhaC/HecB family hemolysin secretion/activation protein [Chlorobiaceae bacterium]
MCPGFNKSLKLLLLLAALFAGSPSAIAEIPDAGNILRDVGDNFKSFPEPNRTAPVIIQQDEEARKAQAAMVVPVKRIVVTGVTLIGQQEIDALVSPYFGKSLTVSGLNDVARLISNRYAMSGYLAQAILPPQEVRDGVVTVEVIEARLGSIEIRKSTDVRYTKRKAAAMLAAAQPKGEFIRISDLERGLLLLRQINGINSSAVIKPGLRKGEVDAVVDLQSTPLISGQLGLDNFGSVSTGEYRWNGVLDLHSPFCAGDRMSIRTMYADRLRYGRFAYSYPVGPNGVIAGFSVNRMTYELGQRFSALDASGESSGVGASVSMPLVLKRRSNLYGLVGYDYRVFRDDMAGRLIGDRRLNIGSFMLTGSWFDDLYGGGYTTAGMTITFGDVDLSRVAGLNTLDYAGPRTSGSYTRLNVSVSRMQYLFDELTTLSLSAAGQLASGNLDSSEKMTLGGQYAVRAYPAGEAPGDEGLLFVGELRRKLLPGLQTFLFYDYGMIRQNTTVWPGWTGTGGSPNTYSLDGVGCGALFMPIDRLKLKATIAWRLKNNPASDANGKDHDGTFRDPRIWFESSYDF